MNVNFDAANVAQVQVLARMLIGRDADSREKMYDDCKRVERKLWAFGYSDLDIALWISPASATACRCPG